MVSSVGRCLHSRAAPRYSPRLRRRLRILERFHEHSHGKQTCKQANVPMCVCVHEQGFDQHEPQQNGHFKRPSKKADLAELVSQPDSNPVFPVPRHIRGLEPARLNAGSCKLNVPRSFENPLLYQGSAQFATFTQDTVGTLEYV